MQKNWPQIGPSHKRLYLHQDQIRISESQHKHLKEKDKKHLITLFSCPFLSPLYISSSFFRIKNCNNPLFLPKFEFLLQPFLFIKLFLKVCRILPKSSKDSLLWLCRIQLGVFVTHHLYHLF
jgi:hypothetical protein